MIVTLSLVLAACAGPESEDTSAGVARLAPCPESPNCVSTEAEDEGHRVEPFHLAVPPERAWARIGEIVTSMPRTRIVRRTETYLHAEARSRIFRFVDDLELMLHGDEARVAVRSASRLGYSDFGVNRDRVERLRELLIEAGLVRR